jgi:hypothetical protein
MIAKETDKRVIQMTRVRFAFDVSARIGSPPDDLVAENVVSLDQVIAVGPPLNCLLNKGEIPGGDALIGVKNKYPGMSGFCQREIPGIGKAVCPFEMKDFG